MTRLPNGWIAAALVITALALINARYHERRLFAESQRLERLVERRASEVENLEVSVASLKTPARLEQTARSNLGMVPIRSEQTIYLPTPVTNARLAEASP